MIMKFGKSGYLLIPVVTVITLIGLGCGKGSTAKKPKITLESITKTVQPNDSMTATFKFNNSGGTLGNGIFVSVRNRLNQVPASQPLGPDTLYTPIPDFNGASQGQFKLVLDYIDYLGESQGLHVNDTMNFTFYALTLPDSLSSDTITSPQIVIINP